MIITQLEDFDRFKVKVYIDGEYCFFLYKKELYRLHIEEETEISKEQYELIVDEIIKVRAKNKVVDLLKFMDRSEYDLRKKLLDIGYNNEIVDITINYAKDYGYINDERYASFYIESRKKTKSRKMLLNELKRKGIDKVIIDNLFAKAYEENETGEDSEDVAIKKELNKKMKKITELTPELKRKIYGSLFRKGYDSNKIKKHIGDIYRSNDEFY